MALYRAYLLTVLHSCYIYMFTSHAVESQHNEPHNWRCVTMAVARWTPFQNLQALQEEMNRRFNDAFRGGNGEETSVGQHQWSPPVDIYETEDALILDVDLPGVSK